MDARLAKSDASQIWSDEMDVALGMRREYVRKGGRVRWEDGLSPGKMLEVMME